MEPTGIIFAALDCDSDAIEAWNRWYDLEHVPPNVAMPGVMGGRRYVATPELHQDRRCLPESPFAAGRATFLTIYTLCGDPAAAFDEMTARRDQLYAADRMRFPPDKKAVRQGDVAEMRWARCHPEGTLPPEEVPFIGHRSVVVVQRRADQDEWYHHEWAPAAVATAGVLGVASFRSLSREQTALDLVYLDGDTRAVAAALRAAAPHHPETSPELDGAFSVIEPLSYPWAGAIRDSDLPATVS